MEAYLTSIFNNKLSDGSIKLYGYKLNKLLSHFGYISKDESSKKKYNENDFDISNFKFINDYDKVIDFIENSGFKNDNKIAYLNAILALYKYGNLSFLDKDLEPLYSNNRNEFNTLKFQMYKDNTKNPDFIDYQELLNLTQPANLKLNNTKIEDVLDRMILYFSVRYPLRLDLYNVKIVTLKKDLNSEDNQLYISNKNISFYMNKFKNVSAIGPQVIHITDDDEKKVIRAYLKYLKHYNLESHLLWKFRFKPYTFATANAYGKALSDIFTKFINKKVTMNDIRRSYESNLINSERYKQLTNKQKEAEHLRLLHSMFAAQYYYNKV